MGMCECSNTIGVFLTISLKCSRYGITKKRRGCAYFNSMGGGMARHAWFFSQQERKQPMKGAALFIAIAAWIAFCGWAVEKIGNLIPDRSMRLLTKLLLFVLFFTMPLLKLMEATGSSGTSGTLSEQKAQRRAVAMSGQIASRKDAP